MDGSDADALLQRFPHWRREGREIVRDLECKDFQAALDFVNQAGAVAEAEGHHPDLRIHGYKHVEVRLSTHAIGGLSENDFILAAKLDQLQA